MLQVVADNHHPGIAKPEMANQIQDFARFPDAERRGRLVHQDDTTLLRGRAANRQGLALTSRQLADVDGQVRHVHPQVGNDLPGVRKHAPMVDENFPARRLAVGPQATVVGAVAG